MITLDHLYAAHLAAQTVVVQQSVNWGQILVVLTGIVCAVAALGALIDKRITTRQQQTERKIETAVSGLGSLLTEKLETKENVASLRIEVAKLSERVNTLVHPPVQP